ncbi:MAG: hypothetical protein AAGM22_06665 [Acidobacteriota bacterium]
MTVAGRRSWGSLALMWLLALATPAAGQTCQVPQDYVTLQDAVWLGAGVCDQIILAAGFYEESVDIDRTVTITTAASAIATLSGQLVVRGAGTVVTTMNLDLLTSCSGAVFEVKQGAAFSSSDFDVDLSGVGECPPFRPNPSLIFEDGFESGDTSAWTALILGAVGP